MAVEPYVNSLLPQQLRAMRADVVAVYDQPTSGTLGNPVFPNAKFLKASITPASKPMEHPLETGAESTDHRIILPIEIELPVLLTAATYRDTYNQIAQIFNAGTLLTVQTRVGTFINQFIISFPHEETPEFFDSIILTLKLKQILFITSSVSETVAPRNPNNSSTVERGTINPTTPTPAQNTQGSTLFRAYKNTIG